MELLRNRKLGLTKVLRTAVLGVVLLGGASALSAQGGPYHGNTDSRIYHAPACRYYNCKHCTATFRTREAAEKAGYRACKVCL